MLLDLFTAENVSSLLTLTLLEVVLGLDNIIFISILAGKLPKDKRDLARKYGLFGALGSRVVLLSLMSWLASLTTPFATILGVDVTGKSCILFLGGLFLMYKSTSEIHSGLEGDEEKSAASGSNRATFAGVVGQIMLIDIVFSIDSVVTAVGMSQNLPIMITANVLALFVMLFASGQISKFVDTHPSIKVLALSFLLMIGLVLVAESAGLHIPKGYMYFAMAFSMFVETINIRKTRNRKVVHLRNRPH
jgi:predicted tellurium resistance membrane protein TerC